MSTKSSAGIKTYRNVYLNNGLHHQPSSFYYRHRGMLLNTDNAVSRTGVTSKPCRIVMHLLHFPHLEEFEQGPSIGGNHFKQHVKLLPLRGFAVGGAEGKR